MVIIMELQEPENIDNSVDHLIDNFSRSLNINIGNDTPYNIYIKDGGLYSAQVIQENTILGEIKGNPCYIWELDHTDYIIIEKEFVLDTRLYKNHIISYVREENETSNLSNCLVRMTNDHNWQTRFLLMTKKTIVPFEELVYSPFDFMNDNDM